MPFGLRTRVGPGNHVLDGGPDPPWEEAFKGCPIVKYIGIHSTVICAETVKPIEMPGLWVLGLDGPKESCVIRGPALPWERGNFSILHGKGASIS